MKKLTLALVLLLSAMFCSPSFAKVSQKPKKPSQYYIPWENKKTALIIDAYWGNEINWDELAKDKRVVAIIHKASEGFRIDKEYAARKKEALKRGYLWGSYHLGRPGDPIAQADHYLNVAKPTNNELIALDLGAISSKFMSLDQARQFIKHIHLKTGRYPVLYVNHLSAKKISSEKGKQSIFAKTPLWYARFRKDIPQFPKGTWEEYSLWQFSSEINCKAQDQCLYNVPGTKYDMDVNVFFGTSEELRAQWPLTNTSKTHPTKGLAKFKINDRNSYVQNSYQFLNHFIKLDKI